MIRRFSQDGTLKAGPVPTNPPMWAFAGADDSLVAITCDSSLTTLSEAIAFDSFLQKLWSIDLGQGNCAGAATVLNDDGRLFVVRETRSGTELLAIQTTSPGPARVSWSRTYGRDSRATGWLVAP